VIRCDFFYVLLTVHPCMCYTVLRGHWFNIIVLNVKAPSEEKTDDSKDSCYE